MLSVLDIHKAYRREPVLNGVTFTAGPGTVLGICGSNGAGKTTLIRIIASILPPDKGEISLMGVPLAQEAAYRRLIGYVPQGIALAERLTVRQNLLFWGSLQGLSGQALRETAEKAAVLAHVSAYLDKPVARCSGGMARCANLAAGLMGTPRLLLLDEPTAGLDEENRELVLQTIRGLSGEGRIILLVNHYADELAQICDRVITLRAGRIHEGDGHVR